MVINEQRWAKVSHTAHCSPNLPFTHTHTHTTPLQFLSTHCNPEPSSQAASAATSSRHPKLTHTRTHTEPLQILFNSCNPDPSSQAALASTSSRQPNLKAAQLTHTHQTSAFFSTRCNRHLSSQAAWASIRSRQHLPVANVTPGLAQQTAARATHLVWMRQTWQQSTDWLCLMTRSSGQVGLDYWNCRCSASVLFPAALLFGGVTNRCMPRAQWHCLLGGGHTSASCTQPCSLVDVWQLCVSLLSGHARTR